MPRLPCRGFARDGRIVCGTAFSLKDRFCFSSPFCFEWVYVIGAVIGLGPQASCVSSWYKEIFSKDFGTTSIMCFGKACEK